MGGDGCLEHINPRPLKRSYLERISIITVINKEGI